MNRKRKEHEENSSEPVQKKAKHESSKGKVYDWKTQLVAAEQNIDVKLSETIAQLFEDEFTIPFLCRYRQNLIQNLSPLRMREIKDSIDNANTIEAKSMSILKSLQKEKFFTPEIENSIKSARSLEELEHISKLYKPPSKGSLFERAQKLGLEEPAENILYGMKTVDLSKLINKNTEGLKTLKEIEEGLKSIISTVITKNPFVMNEVRDLKSRYRVTISTDKKKTTAKDKEKGAAKPSDKFENYFDFSRSVDRIRPHQILAINRGESLKELTVKYTLDDRFQDKLKTFVNKIFLEKGLSSPLRTKLFEEAFTECFKKKISPLVIRQTQSELTKIAEKSAVDTFATNLKNLLLTNPVKGKKILGIDPGFTSGCKLAMISETGELLESSIKFNLNDKTKSEKIVIELLEKFDCSLIAIGNATACRETESFISKLIETKLKHKNVQYCIVSEQGASIYSCSDMAKKEFPKLDVSFIGAISIARRLLDPLCELVKIEPKHLGVGMYQHDVNEKTLKKTLDEVISECVSFVGVDLNIASLSLLKHVAGLTEKRAEAIVKYREEKGIFKSRSDLLKVKSIGQKSFTQCAGFVRINSTGIEKFNPLDSTNVHPESYDVAKEIIKQCSLKIEDIGKPKFVEKIQEYRQSESVDKIAAKFKENIDQVETVLEALSQSLLHDYRSEVKIEPIFKKGIVDMSTLKANQVISGVVMNITDFGAFIDLGVKRNGLIHSSAMKNAKLKVSERVECKVLSVDISKGRIGLEFLNILS